MFGGVFKVAATSVGQSPKPVPIIRLISGLSRPVGSRAATTASRNGKENVHAYRNANALAANLNAFTGAASIEAAESKMPYPTPRGQPRPRRLPSHAAHQHPPMPKTLAIERSRAI